MNNDFKITIQGCSEEQFCEIKRRMSGLCIKCIIADSCFDNECHNCVTQYIHYQKPEEWKPQDGDDYFCIDIAGKIIPFVYNENCETHIKMYKNGNLFSGAQDAMNSDLYKAYKR